MQRNTRQRQAIREVFVAHGRPLGPQEVLAEVSSRVDGIGIATVYRTINTLLEEGWLVAVDLPGQPSRYEIAGKGHHHHFQCNHCHKVFELEGCHANIKALTPPGFQVTNHEVLLYGLCSVCGAGGKRGGAGVLAAR